MSQYGGKLVEIPYTKGVSSSALISNQNSISITPDIRRGILKRLIESKKICRYLEAHNPISAIIAENTYVQKNGKKVGVYPVDEEAWIDVGQWSEYQQAIDRF